MRGLPSHISPAHLAVATVAAWVVWQSASPINDLDSYWHVMLGREILASHSLHGLGLGWLAQPRTTSWMTSQWLSEVGMARLVATFGWGGLIGARIIVLVAILAVVVVAVMRGRPPLLAAPVAILVTIGVGSLAQDRPQTVSLLFLALLGWLAARLLQRRRTPHPLLVAIGCLIWAQIHPLWMLAPVAFVLVAVASALGGGTDRWPLVRRALPYLLASMAGVINPFGFSSFVLPWTFHDATGVISEWQPSSLLDPTAVALYSLVFLALVAWGRLPAPAPPAPLIWVVGWAAFGAIAMRNLGPSLLLCAPVAVDALDRTWGPRVTALVRPTGRREATALVTALVGILTLGAALCAFDLFRLDPLRDAPARHLAERLAASPQPVRVFNSYNASGPLVAFGGGKVRLTIDGRADLWGDAYIKKIIGAQSLRPGWQAVFEAFHPDAVVLASDGPLAVLLEHDRTWRVAATDGDYVLLLPATPQAATAP